MDEEARGGEALLLTVFISCNIMITNYKARSLTIWTCIFVSEIDWHSGSWDLSHGFSIPS